MTDPIRTAALEEWHRVFNDQFWWPARMREHAARCRDFADDMLAAGMIDSLERLDLADLICGAVSHWTEEGRDIWRHPASTYAVMKANGKQIGLLSGTLVCWGGADEFGNITNFGGQIDHETDPTFVHVRSRVGVEFARIHGRWLTKQRKRYALVEIRRLIRNLTHVRCADPDLMVNMLAVDDATKDAVDQIDAALSRLVQQGLGAIYGSGDVCHAVNLQAG